MNAVPNLRKVCPQCFKGSRERNPVIEDDKGAFRCVMCKREYSAEIAAALIDFPEKGKATKSSSPSKGKSAVPPKSPTMDDIIVSIDKAVNAKDDAKSERCVRIAQLEKPGVSGADTMMHAAVLMHSSDAELDAREASAKDGMLNTEMPMKDLFAALEKDPDFLATRDRLRVLLTDSKDAPTDPRLATSYPAKAPLTGETTDRAKVAGLEAKAEKCIWIVQQKLHDRKASAKNIEDMALAMMNLSDAEVDARVAELRKDLYDRILAVELADDDPTEGQVNALRQTLTGLSNSRLTERWLTAKSLTELLRVTKPPTSVAKDTLQEIFGRVEGKMWHPGQMAKVEWLLAQPLTPSQRDWLVVNANVYRDIDTTTGCAKAGVAIRTRDKQFDIAEFMTERNSRYNLSDGMLLRSGVKYASLAGYANAMCDFAILRRHGIDVPAPPDLHLGRWVEPQVPTVDGWLPFDFGATTGLRALWQKHPEAVWRARPWLDFDGNRIARHLLTAKGHLNPTAFRTGGSTVEMERLVSDIFAYVHPNQPVRKALFDWDVDHAPPKGYEDPSSTVNMDAYVPFGGIGAWRLARHWPEAFYLDTLAGFMHPFVADDTGLMVRKNLLDPVTGRLKCAKPLHSDDLADNGKGIFDADIVSGDPNWKKLLSVVSEGEGGMMKEKDSERTYKAAMAAQDAMSDDPGTGSSEVMSEKVPEKFKGAGSLRNEKRNQVIRQVKEEASEAAMRMGARQLVRLVRAPMVAYLQKNLAPGDESFRKSAAEFLETPVGESLLSGVISAALSAMPLRDPAVAGLSRELRVKSIEGVGDAAVEVVMGPLREVLSTFIQGTTLPTVSTTTAGALGDGDDDEDPIPFTVVDRAGVGVL